MADHKKVTFTSQYGKQSDGPVKKKKEFRRTLACERDVKAMDEAAIVLPQEDLPENRIEGQNYYVLSYAAPEGSRARSSQIMAKVSGALPSEEIAKKHAAKIWEQDKRFDVFVVKMYGMVRLPISEDIKPFIKREYADNKFLTKIMKGQYEATRQSRIEMEERMAQDRAAAEAKLGKKRSVGGDSLTGKNEKESKEESTEPQRTEKIQKYDEAKLDREVSAENLNFTQKDLILAAVDFSSMIRKQYPEFDATILGEFIRFAEARQKASIISEEDLDKLQNAQVQVQVPQQEQQIDSNEIAPAK